MHGPALAGHGKRRPHKKIRSSYEHMIVILLQRKTSNSA